MPAFIEVRFWFAVLVLVVAAVLLLTYGKLKGRWLLFAHVTLLFTVNVAFYVQGKLARSGHLASLTKDTLNNISMALMSVALLATLLLLAYVIAIQPQSEAAASAQQEVEPPMTISRALFSYQGRLCRSDYWLKAALPMLPFGILNNVLAFGVNEDWARSLVIVIGLVSLWPASAVVAKRLHDCDKSGWFGLVFLIPFVGPIVILVYVIFLRGTSGPNRFGPDPLSQSPRRDVGAPIETAA